VGHHLAHALAVAAEHGLKPPLLAFCADGLGYGEGEGEALRGSELLWIDTGSCRRLAALRPFPLPGGERASREPRRVALGLLHNADLLAHPGAAAVEAAFSAADRALLLQALAGSCNSPHGSSLGRLFDAVASLLGLAQVLSYEGEGGLRVQGAAEQAGEFAGGYPLPLIQDSAATDAAGGLPLGRLDWEPLLRCLLAEIAAGEGVAVCAARFHRGLASGIAEALATASSAAAAAAAAAAASDCRQVVLGGGCFQNRLLLELCLAELRARGLQPFWPQAVPAGDGGLAVGQVLALRPPWRGSAPT
jgi:hydrogenase maturation protein HypF